MARVSRLVEVLSLRLRRAAANHASVGEFTSTITVIRGVKIGGSGS
jgi:hypothetical protein